MTGSGYNDITSVGANIYLFKSQVIYLHNGTNTPTQITYLFSTYGLVHHLNPSDLLVSDTSNVLYRYNNPGWTTLTTNLPFGTLYNMVSVGGVDYWASNYGIHKRVGSSWVLMSPAPGASFVSNNQNGRISICKTSSPQVIQDLASDLSTWTDFGTPSSFVNPFRYVNLGGNIYVFDSAGAWKYTP